MVCNADLFLLILFTKLIVNDVLVTAIALSILKQFIWLENNPGQEQERKANVQKQIVHRYKTGNSGQRATGRSQNTSNKLLLNKRVRCHVHKITI